MPDRSTGLTALRRMAAVLLVLLLPAACATYDPGNPLQGRWALTMPGLPALGMGTGFALGTYEFRRGSMDLLGVEQEVEYAVAGDRITVMPLGFGPTLEVRMIDADTAEVRDPFTGTPMILRRVRDRGGLFR